MLRKPHPVLTVHELTPEEVQRHLLAEMKENNRLLTLNAAVMGNAKNRFLAGLWTGFGTVVGATVLIGVVIRLLAPLASIDRIGPYIRQIQETLERPRPGASSPVATPDPTPDPEPSKPEPSKPEPSKPEPSKP